MIHGVLQGQDYVVEAQAVKDITYQSKKQSLLLQRIYHRGLEAQKSAPPPFNAHLINVLIQEQ